jgi:hypothetical protein
VDTNGFAERGRKAREIIGVARDHQIVAGDRPRDY